MKAPAFWDRDGLVPALLEPIGWIYRMAGAMRHRITRPRRIGIPVICVGNLVAGGAGKTPVALSIGARLARSGRKVAFLGRGYGGRLSGPVKVDPGVHDVEDVGDEALLLAELAPTWISRDRGLGGEAAQEDGAEVIIMDDGLQNPGLAKNLSIVVVDGAYGFGNGRVIPAGPLRETIESGRARADAVVLIGEDVAGIGRAFGSTLPVLRATTEPAGPPALPPGTLVYGFAGIGRPEKFGASLRALGLTVAGFRGFADHHRYTEIEVDAILQAAAALDAVPVTTAKDHVRLSEARRVEIPRIELSLLWHDEAALMSVLQKALGDAQG